MFKNIGVIPLLFYCFVVFAHETQPSIIPSKNTIHKDNPELTKIYEADQSERLTLMSDDTFKDIHADDPKWKAIEKNDDARRKRVQELLTQGLLTSSRDYYHAAMIFHHGGEIQAEALAYMLALHSVFLDPNHKDAKWLMAAIWDRYLMMQDKLQWYGTQYGNYKGCWVLSMVDENAVTDQQRIQLGVPTLSEMKAKLNSMNEKLKPSIYCDKM